MFNGLSTIHKALLLAIIGNAGFALSDAAVKFLTPHYSIYQIIAFDFLLAAALLLLCAPKLGGLKSLIDPVNMKLHIFRAVCNFFGAITIVYLFSVFPLTSVYTIVFSMPFIMTLIAIPVYKERVSAHRWGAMLIGFAGVLVAFRPWDNDWAWFMWVPLLGAPLFFSALHSAMRAMKGASDLAVGFYPVALAALASMPLVFIMGDFVMFSPLYLGVLLISALGICVGFVCLSRAFNIADASLVAPMQYTQMLWGIVLGYLLFSDLPGAWILGGACVIILSGLYLIRSEQRSF